jgi:hypothetical protein
VILPQVGTFCSASFLCFPILLDSSFTWGVPTCPRSHLVWLSSMRELG